MCGVTGEKFCTSQEWDMGDMMWLGRVHGGASECARDAMQVGKACVEWCMSLGMLKRCCTGQGRHTSSTVWGRLVGSGMGQDGCMGVPSSLSPTSLSSRQLSDCWWMRMGARDCKIAWETVTEH